MVTVTTKAQLMYVMDTSYHASFIDNSANRIKEMRVELSILILPVSLAESLRVQDKWVVPSDIQHPPVQWCCASPSVELDSDEARNGNESFLTSILNALWNIVRLPVLLYSNNCHKDWARLFQQSPLSPSSTNYHLIWQITTGVTKITLLYATSETSSIAF